MLQGSRPQYRVLVEKDVPMQTRDGVTLRADVYRPDASGVFPVLLSRLPYDKNLRPRNFSLARDLNRHRAAAPLGGGFPFQMNSNLRRSGPRRSVRPTVDSRGSGREPS